MRGARRWRRARSRSTITTRCAAPRPQPRARDSRRPRDLRRSMRRCARPRSAPRCACCGRCARPARAHGSSSSRAPRMSTPLPRRRRWHPGATSSSRRSVVRRVRRARPSRSWTSARRPACTMRGASRRSMRISCSTWWASTRPPVRCSRPVLHAGSSRRRRSHCVTRRRWSTACFRTANPSTRRSRAFCPARRLRQASQTSRRHGSAPQSPYGINCTMVYTHVWATYTLKCLAAPALPNNAGTFAPIEVNLKDQDLVIEGLSVGVIRR